MRTLYIVAVGILSASALLGQFPEDEAMKTPDNIFMFNYEVAYVHEFIRDIMRCELVQREAASPFTDNGWFDGGVTLINLTSGERTVKFGPCGVEVHGMTDREALEMVTRMWSRDMEDRRVAGTMTYKRLLAHAAFTIEAAKPDRDPRDRMALIQAVAMWRVALGVPLPIAMPKLLKVEKGACDVEENAAACVSRPRWGDTILIEDIQEGDRLRVMLHEVGHLLGVPHIEGDVVMSKEYVGKATALTPASIVMGKLALGAN